MATLKHGIKYPYQEFKGVKTVTASTTLTKEDSHKLIVIDTTTAVTITLPATRNDLKFTFFVKQLAASGNHAISPNANDTLFFKGASAFAADKDAVHTNTTDVIGDGLTFVGDGVNGYYATEVNGAWAREA